MFGEHFTPWHRAPLTVFAGTFAGVNTASRSTIEVCQSSRWSSAAIRSAKCSAQAAAASGPIEGMLNAVLTDSQSEGVTPSPPTATLAYMNRAETA